MWSERRAEAVLRELGALSTAGLDVVELHAHALDAIERAIPFDAACMGAVDPETLLLTSGVTIGFSPSADESQRFAAIEYGGIERHSFVNLVDRQLTVVADAGASAPVRRHDVRYHELVKLIGFTHDVRLAFMTDSTCWAVGDLYRSGTSSGFDERELGFLERAVGVVARAATRTAVRRPVGDGERAPDGAAVLVVEADGNVSGMTETARRWVEEEHARGPASRLWWAIGTAVATARRGVPAAYTRVQAGGGWLVVRASSLRPRPGDGPVAVTIDRAGSRDLVDLLLAAHGLTARERDICHEVLAGHSTREIAAALFIAPHTVQDHLKSIFAKVGVNSRRELVASFGP